MPEEIDEDIFELPKPPPLDRRMELIARNSNEDYYLVSLSRSISGMNDWHIFSRYDYEASKKIKYPKAHSLEVGNVSGECRCARKISIEKSRYIIEIFEKISHPIWVVAFPWHLLPFYLSGGQALLSHSSLRALNAKLLKPYACVHGVGGWFAGDVKNNGALWSAPSANLRSRVMYRDGFRCLLCGESPRNNVHIQLHLHHIRPLASGGLTEYGNLITVCHTCHQGIHSNSIDVREFMPNIGRCMDQYGPSIGKKVDLRILDEEEFRFLDHLFADSIFVQTESELGFIKNELLSRDNGMYVD